MRQAPAGSRGSIFTLSLSSNKFILLLSRMTFSFTSYYSPSYFLTYTRKNKFDKSAGRVWCVDACWNGARKRRKPSSRGRRRADQRHLQTPGWVPTLGYIWCCEKEGERGGPGQRVGLWTAEGGEIRGRRFCRCIYKVIRTESLMENACASRILDPDKSIEWPSLPSLSLFISRSVPQIDSQHMAPNAFEGQ